MGSGYNLQIDTQNNRFNSASYNGGLIDDLDNATTFNTTKSGSTNPANVNGTGGSYIAWCFAEKKDLANLVHIQVMEMLMEHLFTQDSNQV